MAVCADVRLDDGSAYCGPESSAHTLQQPHGELAVLARFQVNLRCNRACGYCDLPLNVGRYEMTREEIQRVFSGLYRDGVRFAREQGFLPVVGTYHRNVGTYGRPDELLMYD